MSKSDYYHVTDGEWVPEKMRGGKDQCCDCGLVHTINYKIVDGTLYRQVFRHPKATGGARRHKKKK
jgi:hypothetical protein